MVIKASKVSKNDNKVSLWAGGLCLGIDQWTQLLMCVFLSSQGFLSLDPACVLCGVKSPEKGWSEAVPLPPRLCQGSWGSQP